MALIKIALYCSEIRVPVVVGWGGANQLSCQTHNQDTLGWVAVAWLGFWVMTIIMTRSALKILEPVDSAGYSHDRNI